MFGHTFFSRKDEEPATADWIVRSVATITGQESRDREIKVKELHNVIYTEGSASADVANAE